MTACERYEYLCERAAIASQHGEEWHVRETRSGLLNLCRADQHHPGHIVAVYRDGRRVE